MILLGLSGCRSKAEQTERSQPSAAAAQSVAAAAMEPPLTRIDKVEFVDKAMGTEIHFIAFTDANHDRVAVRAAMRDAFREIQRLEQLMSSWRGDSEIAKINASAGSAVKVSRETFEVFEKSLWAGKLSEGTFDISFSAMRNVWRFGDAAQAEPELPDPMLVRRLRANIDYRKIVLDEQAQSVRIGDGMNVDLGGIAKGYAVDRAAAILRARGIAHFLAQAGGDLYGAGHKPDGSKWTSGVQDPRAPRGEFFATIELTDRAFSTAGDYARSFILDGKRYHHIIDPRTGYPATASRSVTIWAPNALLADVVDDAVFILGPKKGLEIVESLAGVGAVIVDQQNEVWVSQRIKDRVRILHPPTDGI